MKRSFIGVLALAMLSAFLALPATPAGAVSCANPTVMTAPGDPAHNPHDGYSGTLVYQNNGTQYLVQQDVWQQVGYQQMTVCNEHDWTAIVNQHGAPATGVKTYPDSQKSYTDWAHCSSQPPVSSFRTWKGSFSEISPGVQSYDWGWDIFLDGGACKQASHASRRHTGVGQLALAGSSFVEIMVLNEWHGVSYSPGAWQPTIDGIAYDLQEYGPGFWQFRMQTQVSAGDLNFKHILRWLTDNGLGGITQASTVEFVSYGLEGLTTHDNNVPFSLNGFSVSDTFF